MLILLHTLSSLCFGTFCHGVFIGIRASIYELTACLFYSISWLNSLTGCPPSLFFPAASAIITWVEYDLDVEGSHKISTGLQPCTSTMEAATPNACCNDRSHVHVCFFVVPEIYQPCLFSDPLSITRMNKATKQTVYFVEGVISDDKNAQLECNCSYEEASAELKFEFSSSSYRETSLEE
jgi:hypothetical protein